MVTAFVAADGSVTVPRSVRKALGLEQGGRIEFLVEKAAVLFRTLHLCDTTNAEFVDSLIFSLAKQAGCSAIFTFDRKAAKALGMQRIV